MDKLYGRRIISQYIKLKHTKTNKLNLVFLLFKSHSEASSGDRTNQSTFILPFHVHPGPGHLHPHPCCDLPAGLAVHPCLLHSGKNELLQHKPEHLIFPSKTTNISHFTWKNICSCRMNSLTCSLEVAAVVFLASAPRPHQPSFRPSYVTALCCLEPCPRGSFCLILAQMYLQTGPPACLDAAVPPLSEIPSALSASHMLSLYLLIAFSSPHRKVHEGREFRLFCSLL